MADPRSEPTFADAAPAIGSALRLRLDVSLTQALTMTNSLLLALAGLGRQGLPEREETDALTELAFKVHRAVKEAIGICGAAMTRATEAATAHHEAGHAASCETLTSAAGRSNKGITMNRQSKLKWESYVEKSRPGQLLKADWDMCRPPIRYAILRIDGAYCVTCNSEHLNEVIGASAHLPDAKGIAQKHANNIVKKATALV
jgi:hypothetical protein